MLTPIQQRPGGPRSFVPTHFGLEVPRVTVWVPDRLHQAVVSGLPEINWSAAMQSGLRHALDCEHAALECSTCGHETRSADVAGEALEAFYRRLLWDLAAHVNRFGTTEGAVRIVRKVALAHGIRYAADAPLPVATKTAREQRRSADPVPLPTEAGARHRHPTNHQENTA